MPLLMGVILFLCAVPATAQGTPAIVGTWRLVTFTNPPDSAGRITPFWDEHPSGRITYTADGHMAAQLYDTRRAKSGREWLMLSDSSVARQARGLTTYFGRYTVDTVARTVSHQVEGAMNPDWVGRTLVRRYRFITADRVELTTVNNALSQTRTGLALVWERVGK